MTVQLSVMTEDEVRRLPAPGDEAGLGALRTERGNLPLAEKIAHALGDPIGELDHPGRNKMQHKNVRW